MENTTPGTDAPMTQDQADAMATIIRTAAQEVGPVLQHMQAESYRHAETLQAASNEAARRMAIPAAIIAISISLFGGVAALLALYKGEYQLTREILLPLLSFAGGLGVGARLLK